MAGGNSDDNAIAVRDGLIVDIDSAENLLQRFKKNPAWW
jgi:hypothetical protein